MLRKRLVYLMIIVATVMFAGCGKHMTKVNVPDQAVKDFSNVAENPENFQASRIFIVPFHELAYDSEGMYGLNYFLAFQKEGSDDADRIDKSGELLSSQILKIDGEQKLVLFDYGNKLDTVRRVLIQSRVVPGIQFPIEGGIENVCAPGIRDFDWKYYKTMDEYIANGTVDVIEINEINDAGHMRANSIIFDILAKYESLGDDSTFEKFLKGLGTFSSNEIHLMIAGSFNPTQLYPAIGVKLFSIIRALSGAADLGDVYYYTKKASAFDVAAMLYNNVKRLKAEIQNELYIENRIQNKNLYEIELRELTAWRDNEIEKVNDWKRVCFEVLEINPENNNLSRIDKDSVQSINTKAEKYIGRIVARFEKRTAFFKELYNE